MSLSLLVHCLSSIERRGMCWSRYHEAMKDSALRLSRWTESGGLEVTRELHFFKPVNLPGRSANCWWSPSMPCHAIDLMRYDGRPGQHQRLEDADHATIRRRRGPAAALLHQVRCPPDLTWSELHWLIDADLTWSGWRTSLRPIRSPWTTCWRSVNEIEGLHI